MARPKIRFWRYFLPCLSVPLISVPAFLLNGYVLSVMWGWFMVPVFALPRLGIAPAIGVSLVIGFLTSHYSSSKKEEDLDKSLMKIFLMPLLSLFIGWVVHSFM